MQSIIDKSRVSELFTNSAGKRIAVIGDVMLDQYFWGSTSRISPEAPVPVVEVQSESVRLGGAANVANNIASLGAKPLLIGITGSDINSDILQSLMNESGFPTSGLIKDSSRPTTIKTRVIAHGQHVVRFDRENTDDINAEIADQIINIFQQNIDTIDALILQDYNKGIFTKNLIQEIIDISGRNDTIVTVDPKFKNFFDFRNVTVFKPNRRELEQAFGVKLKSSPDFERLGSELMKKINAKNVLITRGEYGMTLVQNDGSIHHVPTRTRTVADVSGAGDTVIATLSVMLAAGADVTEASAVANFAGGIVCEEVGIVPIDRTRLMRVLNQFERENSADVLKTGVENG